MKAMIMDGRIDVQKEDQMIHLIKAYLEEKVEKTEWIVLKDKKIKACKGCFGCWLKEPGHCVIHDEGNLLVKQLLNSQHVIYVTPVMFGGYSSQLKKLLDRSIPLVLPFFKRVSGEVHHQPRYKHYPQVLIIGIMEDDNVGQAKTFQGLIGRNAKNWYNKMTGGIIYTRKGSVEQQVNELLIQGGW